MNRKTDIETISTDELMNELRRRSGVFFCIARPLSANGETHEWQMYCGAEGGAQISFDSLTRILGLIEIGKSHLHQYQTQAT